MCRYIIDPQNEGVLLPPKGPDANIHQQKYKISSHVQAFLKQFAQWRSEKLFGSAGPWQLLKKMNSKLEASCKQSDMAGSSMFQAVYVLAPNSSVASVSCALPSPRSLVMASAAPKATSVSAGTLPSSKSKAADKSKSGEKVLCSYCGKMFGKQGIRNHIAKCAEQAGVNKGWGQHKYEPTSDDDDDPDDDDNQYLFDSGSKGRKKTTFTTQPALSLEAGDPPKAPATPEQLLAAAQKELRHSRSSRKGTRTEGQSCSHKQQRL